MPKPVPKPDPSDTVGNKGIGGKRGGSRVKRSGTYFEREVEGHFDGLETTSFAKRIIGSGAFGIVSRDPRLLGDVHIAYRILPKALLAECKFGYKTGKTQMSIKKEWLEKVAKEAKIADRWPALIMKFKGLRGPDSKVIIFTWDTWNEIMSCLTDKVEALERMVDNGRED